MLIILLFKNLNTLSYDKLVEYEHRLGWHLTVGKLLNCFVF